MSFNFKGPTVPLSLTTYMLASLHIYGVLWIEERIQDKMSVLDHGERTTGTIISLEYIPSSYSVEPDWTSPDTYVVKYTFFLPSSGQEVIGNYEFYNTIPSGCDVGDQIEVAYDPKIPTINLPVIAEENEGINQGITWVLWSNATLFSLVTCVIAFFLGRKAWREWR